MEKVPLPVYVVQGAVAQYVQREDAAAAAGAKRHLREKAKIFLVVKSFNV